MDRQAKRVLRLRTHVLNQKNKLKDNDLEELESVNVDKLKELTVKELRDRAKDQEVEGYSNMNKEELIEVLEGD